MGIRQNYLSLDSTERDRFLDALVQVKREGFYDRLVQTHLDAMSQPAPWPGHPDDPGARSRNLAHRGPIFLPWHRAFLLELEHALQRIDERITIPYWDWSADAADPAASGIFTEEWFGGDGAPDRGFRVATGRFAFERGNWILNVDVEEGGTALRRRLGVLEWEDKGQPGRTDLTLPSVPDVVVAMNDPAYDEAPWAGINSYRQSGQTMFQLGFRNRIEGWTSQGMQHPNGPQTHNRVHVFVGGAWIESGINLSGTMQLGSSPNDPIFFLNHCFIDKLWGDWQALLKQASPPSKQSEYLPVSGGPIGHNLNEEMYGFAGMTPASVLDYRQLGYSYDTDSDPARLDRYKVAPKAFAALAETRLAEIDLPPPGVIKSHFLPGDHSHGHGHGEHG